MDLVSESFSIYQKIDSFCKENDFTFNRSSKIGIMKDCSFVNDFSDEEALMVENFLERIFFNYRVSIVRKSTFLSSSFELRSLAFEPYNGSPDYTAEALFSLISLIASIEKDNLDRNILRFHRFPTRAMKLAILDHYSLTTERLLSWTLEYNESLYFREAA
jgi:hypothetical protein